MEKNTNNKDPKKFALGQRIVRARNKVHLNQQKLSDITHMSTNQISAYENGKKGISLESLATIAKATNASLDELYFGTPEEKIITSATNVGELIVNCIDALHKESVLSVVKSPKNNRGLLENSYIDRLRFVKYSDLIIELIEKLDDLEKNSDYYENLEMIRNELLRAYAKKMNE